MDSQEQKQYRRTFCTRLLRAAGCVEPTPYTAMLAEYIHVEPRGGGDVHITVVDPQTHVPMTHQPFGQPVTVHDLMIELARDHPAMAPNFSKAWRN